MSTPNPPPAPASDKPAPTHATAAVPPPPAKPPERREVRIISHCSLFYWWPVWACGFIMFVITWWFGDYMVTVPPKTAAVKAALVDGKQRDVYLLPIPDEKKTKKASFLPIDPDHPDQPAQPHLWMTDSKNLGVVFIAVLLLVIAITNVPLRGLWSAIVIGLIVCLVLLFAWRDWWDPILTWLSWLDIRINAAGYLVISLVLFTLWVVVVFLFDRQIYLVLAPGQLRVRKEVGGAEDIFDTTNMKVQKQRNDFFRHWILGIGSGDLIVKPANSEEIHMPNVLFIGYKVKKIEEMLEIKQVEAARPPS